MKSLSKTLVTISILLTMQANYAKTTIDCQLRGHNHTVIGDSFGSKHSFPKFLGVTFNFSSARVICPAGLDHIVEEQESFGCKGSWFFDYPSEDSLFETDASVSFYHLKNNEWEASFRTSNLYGRELIKVGCNITQG